MRLCIFDGASCIGGNKIYVEFGREGFFLDFGINFSKAGEFFDEFLRERSIRGIHDFLHLGLIPELRIYRKDLVPADVNLDAFPELPVKALLISHAHLDHIGYAGLLSQEIPVIASPETLAIAKAMKDSGSYFLGLELTYYSERSPEEDARVLVSENKAPLIWKKLHTELDDNFLDFMALPPSSRKNFEELSIESLDDFLSTTETEIIMQGVDHSIFGASGFILKNDITIAYTGDFRLHGKYSEKTKKFLKRAKEEGVSVLLIEGTKVSSNEARVSEEDVAKNVEKIIEEASGFVFADFSPKNFERLETFADASAKAGRALVIPPKMAYIAKALESCGVKIKWKNIRVFSPIAPRKGRRTWEKRINEWFCSDMVTVDELKANPEAYVLVLGYYNLKHLLDIKPSSGLYIYSSSEAYGEEREFDFLRLYNWLKLFNIEAVGFTMIFDKVLNRHRPIFDRKIHSSGHLSKEEIIEVIDYLDPELIIPVHTEKPEWFLREFENAKVLREGEWVEI